MSGAEPTELKTDDFSYDLPEDQIAQHPLTRRDDSRLLCLDRRRGDVEHHGFRALPEVLRHPSVLVVNDTRVFPARLKGQLSSGGAVELLLLEGLEGEVASERWRCMGRPRRKLRPGTTLHFGAMTGTVITSGDADLVVELRCSQGVRHAIDELGHIPLPPYIRRKDDVDDRSRYQTIFAGSADRSVAAPTAGLHFTEPVLHALDAAGHKLAKVTLHVGPGTFRPVRSETLAGHQMDGEWCEVSQSVVDELKAARREGRKIVAVGTTVVRTLESALSPDGELQPFCGVTKLFIVPGHTFRVVDGLLTNFHLPRSTLLALVCALAGRQQVLAAYEEALREGYRFYSYGDAMLIQ